MLNISSFPLDALLFPALVIFVIGFAVALMVTGAPHWSLFVAFAKSAVFTLYFALFFDGTFTFLDDWGYLEGGGVLLSQGVSLVNLLAHLPELFSQAGGKHFMYYLYNADSIRLFGQAYYAPVAGNILLTFVAAAFMAAAMRAGLGLSRRLAAGFFVFMALHPDIVAWSTIMNGKDTLVLTGTAMAVYAVSRAGQRRYLSAILLAVMVGLVLFFTRFYVPLLLLSALFGALLLSPQGRRSPVLWLLVSVGLVGVLTALGVHGLSDAYARLQAGFVNPLYGVSRILLTPIPFHTTVHYAFLDLPQVFHWAMMPALVYGVVRVWRRATLTARFVVIYFLLMILLYGMFGNLQGPRHRVQIDGLIALFQFYGALGLLRQMVTVGRCAARRQQPTTSEGARS
ncbi:MAG: hypothetical protein PF483_12785 [Halothiobacillus sp.]|jgi:hypothetical protein|nr:hypothetical protein [Halothiobacillus sp.]